MRKCCHLPIGMVLIGLLCVGHAHAEVLTLDRALGMALDADPGLTRHGLLASAARSDAVASGQLPDPMFRLGAMNLPVDTFDRDQEPMTQIQFGVRQMFPPGATLAYRQLEKEQLAGLHEWDRSERMLMVLRETTNAYVERWHAEQRLGILNEELREYEKLHQLLNTRLNTGSVPQADLLAVQLELANRNAQITGEQQRVVASIGVLARWVGLLPASEPLSEPELSWQRGDALAGQLSRHPGVRAIEQRVAAAEARVAQAREAYSATWGLDLSYGRRDGYNPAGDRRPDLATAMVSVSLPLFTEKRQDAALAARQAEVLAAREARNELLLQLQQQAARAQAELEGQELQLREYQVRILPTAHLQSDSALRAYRSDAGTFEALLRARLAVQQARMARLALQIARYRSIASLHYLAGTLPEEESDHE